MTGCADRAASAALPIPVPLPANRLPDHNHGCGTWDHHLCPRSNGRRFPGWPEPGTSTDGSRGYLLSRRARRPAPSVRYPNRPRTPVHRRQQDREYPDHRTLICRESGNRLGAWSARKTLASPADGERSRHPLNGRDLSVLVRDSPPFRTAHSECDRGSGGPLRPKTE